MAQLQREEVVCECKLEDGRVMVYDACTAKDHDPEIYSNLTYIGSGIIYTVNGRRQTITEKHRFYIKP